MSSALTPVATNGFLTTAMTANDIVAQVQLIQDVMSKVMRDGEHYGVIPGCGDKPALLKAGAEKLCLLFRLDPQFETHETWDGAHYTVKSKCTLYHIPTGQRVGSAEAVGTTKESKHAYRDASRKCPNCGKEAIIKGKKEYGGGWLCYAKKGGCGGKWSDGAQEIEGQKVGKVQNENLADQYNTVLKMANKRSLVAATLIATAASDLFTQDIEDLPVVVIDTDAVVKPESKKAPEIPKDPTMKKTTVKKEEAAPGAETLPAGWEVGKAIMIDHACGTCGGSEFIVRVVPATNTKGNAGKHYLTCAVKTCGKKSTWNGKESFLNTHCGWVKDVVTAMDAKKGGAASDDDINAQLNEASNA